MKPNEIIDTDNTYNLSDRYISSYSRDVSALSYYENKDCVVAYVKETIGTILLIKGEKKYFGFIVTNYRLHGNSCFRPNTKQIYNMFEGNPELKIVDIILYEKFKKLEVVKNL